MDFETLTDADLLELAKQSLRANETNYYQVSLTDEAARGQRLADYETQHAVILDEIARLDAKVNPPKSAEKQK